MVNRSLEKRFLEDLETFRILNLKGARQSGKTTLVKKLAKDMGFRHITFDNPQDLEYAKKMPTEFLEIEAHKTLIIDEIQRFTDILPHIKMRTDTSNRAGQFIITGSADLMKMRKVLESLAGRSVEYELMPFSLAELHNAKTNIVDRLIEGSFSEKTFFGGSNESIFEHAVKGGFPEVQKLTTRQRKLWFKSYINSRVLKDMKDISEGGLHKLRFLPRMLKYLSWQTGGLLNFSSVANELDITLKTVKSYIDFFDTLFLTKIVLPYFSNMGKRQIKTPKLYFADTGLLCYLLNVSSLPNKQFTGEIIENLVYGELLKNSWVAENNVEFYFYRDKSQYEVDFLLSYNSDDLIAVEVKAKEVLKSSDFSGIRKLKRLAGEKLQKAYIFYAGKVIYPTQTEEGIEILALPLQVLLQ